ncbi:acyl-CoA carboxylase subunit epsilon [Streptomyces sp. NPDC002265]|uniref:acyl-CoA carboxylase subunit epsilon n=1 Tax=unclassified Streptomyces TaxID=2593676 RepID=UPI003323C3EA
MNSDIRVEKGHAEPEEVAAITAILLARAAARTSTETPAHGGGHRKAGWRRLEREPGFRAPHSWHG